jgi:hypothetical protein
MREVLDLEGNRIGTYNGIKIVDASGNIIYWVANNEVYSPYKYAEKNYEHFNKGQSVLFGELIENQCIVNGVVIFTIM